MSALIKSKQEFDKPSLLFSGLETEQEKHQLRSNQFIPQSKADEASRIAAQHFATIKIVKSPDDKKMSLLHNNNNHNESIKCENPIDYLNAPTEFSKQHGQYTSPRMLRNQNQQQQSSIQDKTSLFVKRYSQVKQQQFTSDLAAASCDYERLSKQLDSLQSLKLTSPSSKQQQNTSNNNNNEPLSPTSELTHIESQFRATFMSEVDRCAEGFTAAHDACQRCLLQVHAIVAPLSHDECIEYGQRLQKQIGTSNQ
jgi:hypothetical protein